jgi:ribA/ribD-fused uncharacterized protein
MNNNTKLPLSKQELILAIKENFKPKYLFFWGHHSKDHIDISKSCLSQWYLAYFEINKILYPSAEHFMMAEKARLFKDEEILNKILNAKHPGEAKQLGREIRYYNEDLWQQHRFNIVVTGNLEKFKQNIELKDFLINTGDRVLVEASPLDRIWGIGLAENQPEASSPEHWLGLNLLGFALMKVRHLLQDIDRIQRSP